MSVSYNLLAIDTGYGRHQKTKQEPDVFNRDITAKILFTSLNLWHMYVLIWIGGFVILPVSTSAGAVYRLQETM